MLNQWIVLFHCIVSTFACSLSDGFLTRPSLKHGSYVQYDGLIDAPLPFEFLAKSVRFCLSSHHLPSVSSREMKAIHENRRGSIENEVSNSNTSHFYLFSICCCCCFFSSKANCNGFVLILFDFYSCGLDDNGKFLISYMSTGTNVFSHV